MCKLGIVALGAPRWVAAHSSYISLLVALLIVVALLRIALTPESSQWDFRVYYSVALALNAGLDPYNSVERNSVFPTPGYDFYYPPLTSYLFEPFSWFSFGTAYLLWFALKLLALCFLLMVWHKYFVPLRMRYQLFLFLLLAYSVTVYRDLVSGNISTFEQLGLWIAFAFLINRKYMLFGLLVALVSQFKIEPIVFLGLLLLIDTRPRWAELAAAVVTFLSLISLNFVLKPELTRSLINSFRAGGQNLNEVGWSNPSLLTLIRQLGGLAEDKGGAFPQNADLIIYLVALVLILSTSLYSYYKFRRREPNFDRRILIYAGCLVYTVTAARMKDYSFMICLIPTLSILRLRWTDTLAFAIPTVCLFTPSASTYFRHLTGTFHHVFDYFPLLAAGAFLLFYLKEFNTSTTVEVVRLTP